jgi:hypothetical protein
MFKPRTNLFVALFVCCVMAGGCAITDRNNRLVLNSLDNAVQDSAITNSTAGRIAAAPLAIPAGTVAGVLDMAIVTPARAVRPAWKDTSEYLWEDPQGSDMRQMMLFVPKVVATPLLFTGDWAFRSSFGTKF